MKKHSTLAIQAISNLVQKATGIQLNENHIGMVESRLEKRLLELNLPDLEGYMNYLVQNLDTEKDRLIGLLTTHHTYFFREFSHFEFIMQTALLNVASLLENRPEKKLKVWSAACSKGHEVYSLAMFLDLYLKKINPTFTFEILGTDVDIESIQFCKNGVYPRSDLKEVPLHFLGNHWAKGTQEIANFVKVKQSLRNHCVFMQKNLLDKNGFELPEKKYDLIFCRNVFIYFNSQQIKTISQNLLQKLEPHGYFFIGISETLHGLELPIQTFGPSIYGHVQNQPITKPTPPTASPPSSRAPSPTLVPNAPLPSFNLNFGTPTHPLRIVCVDDSHSILMLLKKILVKEAGFEVIGTACNGIEAEKVIRELKPDAITLDIHMPERTGIEYLEKSYHSKHPPVIMVTSVSREDAQLAGKAISLGASDYVEKPALNNLNQKSNELKTKIKSAFLAKQMSIPIQKELDAQFLKKFSIQKPETKVRIFAFSLSFIDQVKKVFLEKTDAVPTLFLIDGAKTALTGLQEVFHKKIGSQIKILESPPSSLGLNDCIALDLTTSGKSLGSSCLKNKKISINVFGSLSQEAAPILLSYENTQLLLEDLGGGKGDPLLAEVATDIVPITSFYYLSMEYLCKET